MPVGLGGEQGWWCPTLDDSPDDISGNGNNGTYQGGMGTVADTGSGGTRAYSFDGTNDNLTTPYADTAITASGVFSYSLWVEYGSVAATSGLMSGSVQTGNVAVCTFFDTYSSARGHHGLLNPGVGGQYSGRTFGGDRDSIVVSQWYHISYTGDGSTARLYKDGVEIGNATFGLFSSSAWLNPLTLGCFYTGSSPGTKASFLNGKMDDCRIYSRTITPTEITHLATARGVLGGPGSDGYNAFTSAIYNPRNYNNTRYG